jgi:hypothetical protein
VSEHKSPSRVQIIFQVVVLCLLLQLLINYKGAAGLNKIRQTLTAGRPSVRSNCTRFVPVATTSQEAHEREPCLAHACQPCAILCTSCVQEGGFEGPENGPKQRRIYNRLLSYRPDENTALKF